ncbi:GntR family transcriptional regulator [Methylopila sp. 73B]|uniref:GntR family transcriptional regulator n=1 Tax=Methylopila sp. 73B TaxID=1120792 RepID=UPI000371D6B7|nr:GntR family transcriptional regulator [Methylopila sp. 73B]
MPPSTDIEASVIDAILAGRIRPGTRLGETKLAALYGVSRTLVREAMMRLETRGVVEVSARRGWFVVEPSAAEAAHAFHARRVVEAGMLHTAGQLGPEALASLRRHVEAERAAIGQGDVHARTCLLGDFHIHLAEAIGNPVLVAILRDLTARTILISMMYQSTDRAVESSREHDGILEALEAGDNARAVALMVAHIDHVQSGLDLSTPQDPLAGLREILSPDGPRRPPSACRIERLTGRRRVSPFRSHTGRPS